jgi:hypothetical protein
VVDLETGMRVAEDIVAANGLVLIGRGTVVTELLLDRLDQLRPDDRDRRAGAGRAGRPPVLAARALSRPRAVPGSGRPWTCSAATRPSVTSGSGTAAPSRGGLLDLGEDGGQAGRADVRRRPLHRVRVASRRVPPGHRRAAARQPVDLPGVLAEERADQPADQARSASSGSGPAMSARRSRTSSSRLRSMLPSCVLASPDGPARVSVSTVDLRRDTGEESYGADRRGAETGGVMTDSAPSPRATCVRSAARSRWWRAVVPDPSGADAIGYLFMPAGGAAAVWAVAALLRRGHLDPAARRFWRLLLVGITGLTLGYAWLAVTASSVSPELPYMSYGTAVPAGAGLWSPCGP